MQGTSKETTAGSKEMMFLVYYEKVLVCITSELSVFRGFFSCGSLPFSPTAGSCKFSFRSSWSWLQVCH